MLLWGTICCLNTHDGYNHVYTPSNLSMAQLGPGGLGTRVCGGDTGVCVEERVTWGAVRVLLGGCGVLEGGHMHVQGSECATS